MGGRLELVSKFEFASKCLAFLWISLAFTANALLLCPLSLSNYTLNNLLKQRN